MARRLIWAPEAITDLDEIVEHIAQDNEILAKQFAKQIIDQVAMIPSFPFAGRLVPEAPDKPNVRERIYKSVRLIYRVREDSIEIYRVFHQSRLLEF